MTKKSELSKLLRNLRDASGKTLAELADEHGFSSSYYRACESDKYTPTDEFLSRVSIAFNYNLKDLLELSKIAKKEIALNSEEYQNTLEKSKIINNETIGWILKKYEIESGITQKELASKIGCSNVTLGYWQKLKSPPPIRQATAIANAIGEDPEFIKKLIFIAQGRKINDENENEKINVQQSPEKTLTRSLTLEDIQDDPVDTTEVERLPLIDAANHLNRVLVALFHMGGTNNLLSAAQECEAFTSRILKEAGKAIAKKSA